jgi:hypothetical protein
MREFAREAQERRFLRILCCHSPAGRRVSEINRKAKLTPSAADAYVIALAKVKDGTVSMGRTSEVSKYLRKWDFSLMLLGEKSESAISERMLTTSAWPFGSTSRCPRYLLRFCDFQADVAGICFAFRIFKQMSASSAWFCEFSSRCRRYLLGFANFQADVDVTCLVLQTFKQMSASSAWICELSSRCWRHLLGFANFQADVVVICLVCEISKQVLPIPA